MLGSAHLLFLGPRARSSTKATLEAKICTVCSHFLEHQSARSINVPSVSLGHYFFTFSFIQSVCESKVFRHEKKVLISAYLGLNSVECPVYSLK